MSDLKWLSELYPNIAAASKEIINLQSILNLPKGTEHFISDIHGEYEAFSHVLKNGSGAISKKIDGVFGHTLGMSEKKALATLIYYPKQKIQEVKKEEKDIDNWYRVSLYRLIEICRVTSSKYTRSKLRKAMPEKYAYIIEELITEKAEVLNKEAYYDSIVDTIIEIGQAESFIVAMCDLIQRLVIDRLHVIGDIFDRGPQPDKIMDKLMDYHAVDIQWGNHDIVWMGAAAGQLACIANVIRNQAAYDNLDVLEDGYGINLLPIITFAMSTYAEDMCENFEIARTREGSEYELLMNKRVLKAITVIQFKLEGQLIQKYPEFEMKDRLILERVDWENHTVEIDGVSYQVKTDNYPTLDFSNPYELTEAEMDAMLRLQNGFMHCEKLQRHVQLLLDQGSIYKVVNHNLLYHGCVPLNEDGSFRKVNIYGSYYEGKALYDILEVYVRKAFSAMDEEEQEKGKDILWFIWCSPNSPLFGKDKMATLEKYLIVEKEARVEKKDSYYRLLDNPQIVDHILKEFGCDEPEAHIINGHVPVHIKEGERPVRCNGKVIIIDGGFSKPYQKVTGIAGYTLIYNSYGMALAAHQPFVSTEEAIRTDADIISKRETVYQAQFRQLVKDTDTGKEISEKIVELKNLLKEYRSGRLKERNNTYTKRN